MNTIFPTSSGVMLARSFDTTKPAVLNSRSLGTLVAGTDRYLDVTTAKPGACISYTAALPPPPHVTQQQQQQHYACCCEGGCHLVDTGRLGRLQYLMTVPVHWGKVHWVTTDSMTWLSMSNRALAVLLSHSRDLDLATILARMDDRLEPYVQC